jgi:hypothetical protein
MPAGVSDSAAAQRLDDVLTLRDLVEQYRALTFHMALDGTDIPGELETLHPTTQTDHAMKWGVFNRHLWGEFHRH